MIRIRATLTITILTLLTYSYSQEGFSDWEKSYFNKNASTKQKAFVNRITIPDNLNVPTVKSSSYGKYEKYGWDACLKRSFAAFFTEAKSYGYKRPVALAYGLLNLGNFDVLNYQYALKSHFNDTAWVEQTYKTLTPLIKESWSLLDKNTKLIYISIIKHTERYLRTFNYNEELKYYNQLEKSSTQDQFIVKGNKSTSNSEYRKAETFIFRRIKDANENNGNWNKRWIKKMLIRMKRLLRIA